MPHQRRCHSDEPHNAERAPVVPGGTGPTAERRRGVGVGMRRDVVFGAPLRQPSERVVTIASWATHQDPAALPADRWISTPATSSAAVITPADDPRRDAFDRLIVQAFEPILACDDVDSDDGIDAMPDHDQRISRETLAGFLAVLHEALGERRLAAYRKLCRTILVRVSTGRRVPRWRDFFADGIARRIRENALIRLALHLERVGPSADTLARLIHDSNRQTGRV